MILLLLFCFVWLIDFFIMVAWKNAEASETCVEKQLNIISTSIWAEFYLSERQRYWKKWKHSANSSESFREKQCQQLGHKLFLWYFGKTPAAFCFLSAILLWGKHVTDLKICHHTLFSLCNYECNKYKGRSKWYRLSSWLTLDSDSKCRKWTS